MSRLRRTGVAAALLLAIGLLFWITAVVTSGLPDTLAVAVNVHGLNVNPAGPTGAQRPAPMSLSVLADAQQDSATAPGSSPAPVVRPTAAPTPAPRPTPAPTALPTLLPTPSLTPLPTPTLPIISPTPTGAATIAGQVTDGQTHVAIPGATVSLAPGGNSVLTDTNGNFSFGVSAGTYTVTASAPTYNSSSSSVTVKGGQKVSIALKLTSITAYGSIAGTVTDSATQAPIVGATVALSNGLARVTDVNGNFSFSIVLNGTYTMTVTAVGYVTQTLSVTVKPGHTTNVQVALVHA